LDYLNQDSAVPATIVAGWLFNPSTVEYRGRVFLSERFDPTVVEQWFERHLDEPARIEAVINRISLFDLFTNCDLDRYVDSLGQLAADVGACWLGVLTARYPDRVIRVRSEDGTASDAYGPAVSFWTEPRS
jgi:hypothetical protein